MNDIEKSLNTLFRPPSVINWVRHNMKRLDETQRRLRAFVLRPPRHSLSPVYDICKQIVNEGKSLDHANEQVNKISQPIARMAAREIIPCFYDYVSQHNLEGIKELDKFEIPYPIGRKPDGKTLTIPLKPTFVTIQSDKLVPYFIVGWSHLALNDYQKQLLSTIICKAVLTHQTFIGSEAQIVCFPRIKGTKVRYHKGWPATMYGTLSDDELLDQFNRYGTALNLVARELRGE